MSRPSLTLSIISYLLSLSAPPPIYPVISRHRYSDFEKLHLTLHTRYGQFGLLVPSLPPKNILLKGAGFHFSRMRGLSLFCEAVASNPYLLDDDAWQKFLVPDASIVAEVPDPLKLPTPPVRWMQAVDNQVTPQASGELLAKLRTEAKASAQAVHDLNDKSRKCIAALVVLGSTTQDLAAAFTSISEMETNDVDHLNSMTGAELLSNNGSNSVPNLYTRAAQLLSTNVSPLNSLPDAMSVLLVESLEYEASQMTDLHEMVRHIEVIVAANDKLERTLVALQIKTTAKMTQDKIDLHTASIEEAKRLLDNGRLRLDKYIRALCAVTLPLVATGRRERVRNFLNLFAAAIKAVAGVAVKGAEVYVAATPGADADDANTCASTILENLALPPLPEATRITRESQAASQQAAVVTGGGVLDAVAGVGSFFKNVALGGGTTPEKARASESSQRKSLSMNMDSNQDLPPPPDLHEV